MRPIIESLEGRRLLSATAALPHGTGLTLDVNTGQAFTQSLGQFTGISTNREAKLNVTALVRWGDGSTATAGTVTIDSSGNIIVSGGHTYSKAGKYAVTVSLKGASLNKSGKPTSNTVALGSIKSSAIAAQANSSGGVTIDEVPGVAFTTSVGTFTTLAPGTHLHASINWGDGSTSVGTLKSVSVIGLDEIEFEVDGTHTYAAPGTYPIQVSVTKTFAPATVVQVVANIDSTAVVAAPSPVNLNGTITGTFIPAPTAAAVGATYVFNGTGTTGDLGAVSAHATITIPGLVATTHATGTLTLSRVTTSSAGAGTVTLALSGPMQSGSSTVPSTLNYTITGGTGVDSGATGSGTIAVTLGPGSAFTFGLTSA